MTCDLINKTMMIPALISHELHQQLLDRKNYRNRTYGVEKLKLVLSEVDIKSVPCESIEEFLNFLPGLLEDSNFKVMFSTLQVLNLLIQKLDMCANKYFEHIVLVALKTLGDTRTITRNEHLNVFRQLMKAVPPQRVLDLVIGNLKHEKSRVREDVLNVIMVAILSHREIEFNIPKLCLEVAPYLVDSTRKVRHSAFELFALFNHCLGSGKKHALINAVKMVELKEDAEGLMAAVEARQARNALPKLSSDGILEYGLVLLIPRQRGSLHSEADADLDWVMDGPQVSSARSHRTEPDGDRLHEYGSLGSLNDDHPPQRRIASAGKGKNKLPWEKSSLSSTEDEPLPSNTPNGRCSQQVESNDFIVQPREPEAYVPSFGSGEPLKSRRREFPAHLRRSGSLILNPDALKMTNISDKYDGESKGSALSRNLSVEQNLASLPTTSESFFLPSYSHSALLTGSHSPPMALRHTASSLSKSSTWPNKRESSPLHDAQSFNDDCLDKQEMLNSLRSLHNSAAKKRAKAYLSSAGLDSLDSAVRADFGLDSTYTFPERTSSASVGVLSSLSPSFNGFKASSGNAHTSRRMLGASENLRVSVSMDFSSLQDDLTLDVGVVGQKVTCTAASTSSPGFTPLPKQTFSSVDCSSTEPLADIDSHVQPDKDYRPSTDKVKEVKRRNARPRQSLTQSLHLEQLDDELPEGNQGREKIRHSVQKMLSYSQEEDERSTINKELYCNTKSLSDEATPSPTSPIKCDTPTPPHQPSPPTVSPNQPKSAPRLRRRLSRMSLPSPSLSPDELARSPSESSETSNVQKPDMAMTLDLMSAPEWEKKIQGLTNISLLVKHNPDVIQGRLHDVCLSVIAEVKNNRSAVERAALCALGDMFTYLEGAMDCKLDETVKQLLKKAQSNAFIRQDADEALDCMIQHCTPSRCLHALLAGGLNDRCKEVRNFTAQHLADLVAKIGAARIVSGAKDVTEKLIPALGQLAQDASPEARSFGRKMLLLLSDEPKFDKVLGKYIPPKDLATIQKIVNKLRTRDINDEPLDSQSARAQRSQRGKGAHRGQSLNREPVNKTNSRYSSRSQTQSVADKDNYIKQLSGLMGSKDFRDRIQGIDQIVDDSKTNPNVIISNIHPVFDGIRARLIESNSKVNLHTLKALPEIIAALEDNLAQVVNTLVPAIVDNHLNSKKDPIYCAAIGAIDALIAHLDNTHLLQLFCNKAMFLNGKAKADLIEKVAAIVTNIHYQKPQVVKQKVLPLLWHLLGISTHSSSIHNLCRALYEEMGSELPECAASQPLNVQNSLNKILSSLP